GWSMSIVIPDEEIYRNLKRMGLMVSLLTILGLLLLLFILRAVAEKEKSYRELNAKKGMMEHELMIGRKIQQSMIPHIFPPFPERTDLDMSACLVPAKEVGGDLFDFYIRDEKLFFCIGDVSGKGVPASLVMAVTRSMFRTVSGHENNAAKIVRSINDSMSDMNDSNMFVTFFVGILDLKTGHLCYCNAGHNPPLILTDSIRELDVMPNVALGIIPGMEFVEQETDLLYDDALFLYTDGLNEAENAAHEQFGMKRMYEVLHTRRGAQAHLDAVVSAVKSFVGDAPQSDDLTMLFIHFLGGANGHILHLNNAISEISRLEGFMVHVASETGIDPGTASAINLALEEAVANVIDYAYPEGVKGPVELEFKNTPRRLTFILTDEGKEFDPTAAPEVDINADVEHRRIGGLGIHLVRNIMDSVSYLRKDGKNILTMIKNI
ncbi:MAG: SpoIIE family protein phosphatase, partial [Bacteroidales bacterium]|nr:SpoIIE family protein phosphatase [Bacteroidales bacterium]